VLRPAGRGRPALHQQAWIASSDNYAVTVLVRGPSGNAVIAAAAPPEPQNRITFGNHKATVTAILWFKEQRRRLSLEAKLGTEKTIKFAPAVR
jgi:hypothetical protein